MNKNKILEFAGNTGMLRALARLIARLPNSVIDELTRRRLRQHDLPVNHHHQLAC